MKQYLILLTLVICSCMVGCQTDDALLERIEILSLGDSLHAGKEYQLQLQYYPKELKDARVSWVVSDPTLASIYYGGLLKPLKKGSISITATVLQANGKKIKTVKSFNIFSSGVYLKNRSIVLKPLEIKKLEFDFLPKDYVPSEPLTWISSNEEAVAVNQEGEIKGLTEGMATVRVRMGNPFSDFFSEDSCLVTVQNFIEPSYSYIDGVLIFEQEVAGLLPAVATDMPHFKELRLRGPINGSDLLFFIENSEKIEKLNLSETRVQGGGRFYKKKDEKDESITHIFKTEEDSIPGEFLKNMKIPNLIVPPYLKSAFDFGREFVRKYLEFPDSYEEIKMKSCNVNELRLPENLQSFIAYEGEYKKIPLNFFSYTGPSCIFNKKINFPASIKNIACAAVLKEEFEVPEGLETLQIGDSLTVLRFNSIKKLKRFDCSIFSFSRYPNREIALKIEKIILPTELDSIQDYFAFFEGIPIFKIVVSFDTIVFPASLKKIGTAAFANCWIKNPIELPEGFQKLGQQAFYKSTIEKVLLPSTLTSIGEQAFALCNSLEEVHCKAVSPPSLGKLAFFRAEQYGRMYKLFVPLGSKAQYLAAGYGEYFFEIIEE